MIRITLLALILIGSVSVQVRALGERDADSEAKLIKLYPQAKRSGPVLTIKTTKSHFEFTDDQTDGEASSKSYLIEAFNLGHDRVQMLVVTYGYEGYGYSLIDLTSGAKIALSGKPILSPKRDRYLSRSMDLEAGEMPNELSVVKASDLSFEFHNTYQHQQYTGPEKARWISEDEIALTERSIKIENNKPAFNSKDSMLKRSGGKWNQEPIK